MVPKDLHIIKRKILSMFKRVRGEIRVNFVHVIMFQGVMHRKKLWNYARWGEKNIATEFLVLAEMMLVLY
jgi:hypothetical protein